MRLEVESEGERCVAFQRAHTAVGAWGAWGATTLLTTHALAEGSWESATAECLDMGSAASTSSAHNDLGKAEVTVRTRGREAAIEGTTGPTTAVLSLQPRYGCTRVAGPTQSPAPVPSKGKESMTMRVHMTWGLHTEAGDRVHTGRISTVDRVCMPASSRIDK